MADTPVVAAGRRLAEVVPSGALDAVKPLYFRYLSRAADRRFEPPERAPGAPDRAVERAPGAPDHVLVVCVDALRPDARPDVDLDFTTAVAPAPWTVPSVTSLHTGLPPREHGAVARTTPEEPGADVPEQADATALPAVLEAAGYRSYCAAAFLTPFLAVRGWYRRHRVYDHVRASRVVDGYRSFRGRNDRTFAYLHLGDLHAPLTPPAEYVDRRGVDRSIRGLADLHRFTDSYDGSRECDRFRTERLRLYRAGLDYVGEVLKSLVADVRGDTLVVVCGDHGEAHWEHYEVDRRFSDARPNYGVGHGGTPLDAVARVPVAVVGPDGPVTPAGGWPSLLDVPRTVAGQVLRDDPFPGGDEESPSAYDWAEPIPDDRVAVCEGTRYPPERKAAYRGRYKLLRSAADDVTLAAAITADGEDFDARVPPDVREALLAALPPFRSTDDRSDTERLGRMARERLEDLGYV